MRHDWILDVLADLHAYACENDLPAFADRIEEALGDLQREVACGGEALAPAVLLGAGRDH